MANKWSDDKAVVSFPEWEAALSRSRWDRLAQAKARASILDFLRWCKKKRCFICIATAKAYVEEVSARYNPNRHAIKH
jgi:hypothetical protein